MDVKIIDSKAGKKKVIHNHYDYLFVSEILKIPSTHRSFNHIRFSIGTNYVARDDNAKDAPNWKIMKSKLLRSTHVCKTRKGSRYGAFYQFFRPLDSMNFKKLYSNSPVSDCLQFQRMLTVDAVRQHSWNPQMNNENISSKAVKY